jgi:hypothetical protein
VFANEYCGVLPYNNGYQPLFVAPDISDIKARFWKVDFTVKCWVPVIPSFIG